MSQQFAPKYRNNITHTRVMSLWGRNEENTAASFNLYITGNVLHLTVWTGLTEDKNRNQKTIKFDFKDQAIPSFLMAVFDSLRNLADLPNDGNKRTVPISIYGFVKYKGMDKAERKEIGKILVGRDQNGIFFISATNNTHGKVKFNFELDRDMVLYDVNSTEPLDKAEVSRRVMLAFVRNAEQIIANVLTQEYVDKDSDKPSNNNNSNNNNRQSNNNNSSKSNNDSFDDFDDFLP